MADRPIQEVITRVVYEVENEELKKSATLVGTLDQQARQHSRFVKQAYADQMRVVRDLALTEANLSKQQVENAKKQSSEIEKLNKQLEEAKKKLGSMDKESKTYKEQEKKIAMLNKELTAMNLSLAATKNIMLENNKTVGDSINKFTQASEAYAHLEGALSAAAQVGFRSLINPEDIRASVSELVILDAEIKNAQEEIVQASDAMLEFTARVAAGKQTRVELLQTLGDQNDELNKQVKILENLEKQQKESGKSNKKLSQEIEAQKAIIEAYQSQVDETVESLNNYDAETEELVDNLNETNEAQVLVSDGFDGLREDMDRASKSIKGFIKAGLVGALLAIGNEIRKLPSVGNFFEDASNGIGEFFAGIANGDGIFGGGLRAAKLAVEASKELRKQRVAMAVAETKAADAQKKRVDFQAQLDDPLSNISQRVAATKGLYDLEIQLIDEQIIKQREYNKLYIAQNKERRENGNEAIKLEIESNKQKLLGLEAQKKELKLQRPEAVKDLKGRNDIEQVLVRITEFQKEIQKRALTISNLGVNGVSAQEITQIRSDLNSLNQRQAAEAIALAENDLEKFSILVNQYASEVKGALDGSKGVGYLKFLQKELVAAQRKLEDLNNEFAKATADGIIEGYVAEIQSANTELQRLLGEGKFEEALAKANEIRGFQSNLQTSQEASNPDLDLDKNLQDNIKDNILKIANPEDREKEREIIENEYQQEKLKRELASIEDHESLKAKTIMAQLAELEKQKAILQEEYRHQRLERELNTVLQIAELGQQLGTMILEAEEARLNKMIELQEERVSEAERIADEGNAKQLQLEEERLDKLLEEREKAQKKQEILTKAAAVAEIAVNTALTLSNLSVMSAKAGAQSGVAAPVVVPTILAIIAGIIGTVGALYTPPSFWEGTEGTIGEAIGLRNYSGQRDPLLVRVDPRERILNADISRQLEGIPSSKIPELLNKTSIVKPFDTPLNVDIPRLIDQAKARAEAKAQQAKDDKQEASNKEVINEMKEIRDDVVDAVRSINIKMSLDEKGFMSIVKSERRKEKRKRDRLG